MGQGRYCYRDKMATFRTKVRAVAVVLGLPLTYASCSTQESAREAARRTAPRFVKMETKFEYSEHEPYAKQGENGIRGQGAFNQKIVGAVSCAGNRALLLPATSYFREMMDHLVAGSEPDPPKTPQPSLKNMIRATECDAQGGFSFTEIPDGSWFVLTQVKTKPVSVLIQEVTVSNHRTIEVLLSEKDLVGR